MTKGVDSGSLTIHGPGSSCKSGLPLTPETEHIQMFFTNGIVATVRASGTEPKIKYYTESRTLKAEEVPQLKDQLERFVKEAILSDFLKFAV